ncbi:hypothetical protein BH18ACI5_BH18ACI5_26340 [soil metagenome]
MWLEAAADCKIVATVDVDRVESISRSTESTPVAWVSRAAVDPAAAFFAKLLVQAFGEVAEAARGVAEVGVLLFKHLDPVLEETMLFDGTEGLAA